MITLASKIFKMPHQKAFALFLFCTINLCIAGSVSAQQPTPVKTPLQLSTPSPASTVTTDERIRKLEEQVQQINNKSVLFGFIGSLIGSVVTLIGAWLLYSSKTKEIAVSSVQTINSFLPQLQSRYIEDVEIAIKLVVALGDIELAISLVERYETGTAIPIFQRLISEPDSKVAQSGEKTLKVYLKKLNLSRIKKEVQDLAEEYEKTNKEYPYGKISPEKQSEKTRMLASIFSKMKRCALAAFPLLPELTGTTEKEDSKLEKKDEQTEEKIIDDIIRRMKMFPTSDVPSLPKLERPNDSNRNWFIDGKRLFAVAILQVQPNPDYLDWLATVLAREEDSFLGYQASVSIRNAAYRLGVSHRAELLRIIEFARNMAITIHGASIIEESRKKSSSFAVLVQAEEELQKSLN
jgi:hypothetical protein